MKALKSCSYGCIHWGKLTLQDPCFYCQYKALRTGIRFSEYKSNDDEVKV